MTTADVIFIVFGLTLATALLAPRLGIPAPVVFAAVGIAVGAAWHLVPTLPRIRMPPDQVLFVFLRSLLTTAAYGLPLRAFLRSLLPIALLAVGLVLVTTAVGAVIGHALAGLGWAAAFVLGAIVTPPDPVAATAVAERTGLAHRLVVILEGEGLVNDAVAIAAYGIALQSLTGGSFDPADAAIALLREAPIGVIVGLAAGWTAGLLRRRVDSVPLEICLSLATPYLAYHVADLLGGSAVLAVVTLGLMLRASLASVSSPVARLAARTSGAFCVTLPLTLGGDGDGDGDTRRTIIFLTLILIVATLVLQGVTLLPLVRSLKVGDPNREHREELSARRRAARESIASAKGSASASSGSTAAATDDLVARLASGNLGISRHGLLGRRGGRGPSVRDALEAQRRVVNRLRDAGRMGSALAERLDTELDIGALNAAGDGARVTEGGTG